jgi:glutamyl-Q tRNA(Asp) synthetase
MKISPGWASAVRRQSEHLDDYRRALSRLARERLVYRCFKTRAQVLAEIGRAPHGPVSAYHGQPLAPAMEARLVAEGRPYAWRLSLAEAERRLGGFSHLTFSDEGAGSVIATPRLAGDVILARKDVGVAYHLAVVVDDALQGVTDVIRGADLFEATHIQRLLQALLDLPTPAYRHHRLLLGADGRRYAKRDRAETLRDIRARGITRQALLAELAVTGEQ